MAMYYQGSTEIQGDAGLQTLYLMNPNNYVGFSDTSLQQSQQQQQSAANVMFFNSGNALTAGGVTHARLPHSQHLVGVPLPASAASLHDPNRSLWATAVEQTAGNGVTQIRSAAAAATAGSGSGGGGGTTDFASQLGFHRSVVVSPTSQQGLSLSLSHGQQHQPFIRSITAVESPVGLLSARESIRDSGGASSSSISNGISGWIMGSKYLKAAQELMDEVVNVENYAADNNKVKAKMKRESMPPLGDLTTTTNSGGDGGESGAHKSGAAAAGAELTTAQRQELQMRKAKLLSMLAEVELRYRQYHQQMQVIVASFEQTAGIGSAKSYTHLALSTISKQFRCLKVAITSQIKATTKNLGEEEATGLLGGSSRLKFLEQRNNNLQHLGMMQPNNAWRPQRGLPERAVSVFRAWLFEHFLHPYPKDSDKVMLARQTGLTRSQVSNWFINARVRLWKPMVEDMYAEEMKGHTAGSEENPTNTNNNEACQRNKEVGPTSGQPENQENPRSIQENNNNNTSPTEISTCIHHHHHQGAFAFINTLNNMENPGQRNGKKPRNNGGIPNNSPSSILSVEMEVKSSGENGANKGYNGNYPDLMSAAANTSNAFSGFAIGDFGRLNPENLGFHAAGNGVSLTLGLPPSENQQNYLSNHHDIELGRRIEMGRMGIDNNNNNNNNNPQTSSHSNINGGYETIDFQNGKRFAAQLLPDFVT